MEDLENTQKSLKQGSLGEIARYFLSNVRVARVSSDEYLKFANGDECYYSSVSKLARLGLDKMIRANG